MYSWKSTLCPYFALVKYCSYTEDFNASTVRVGDCPSMLTQLGWVLHNAHVSIYVNLLRANLTKEITALASESDEFLLAKTLSRSICGGEAVFNVDLVFRKAF